MSATTITTKGLTFEKVQSCGVPAFLYIAQNGQRIGHFYYNMRGYNQDFQLRNSDGVGADLGERGKTTQIRELKAWIRRGFNQLTPYDCEEHQP